MNVRIVVPLDQSAVAEAALPLARGLASQFGARVTLLRVIEVSSAFGHHVGSPIRESVLTAPAPMDRFERTRQSPYGNWAGWTSREPSARQVEDLAEETASAERYLSAIAGTFEAGEVETMVKYGQPAERILELAESRENSMIVLASHGRSGIGRAVVGSIALRVVQGATMPVFVVRATSGQTGAGTADPIQRILIPVDGSAFSERSIQVVSDLFGANEPSIHLLHVVETPRFANVAQAQGYTNWLASRVAENGIPTTSEIIQGGSPANHINVVARQRVSDIVAMSTHGRTGIDRFVLGSVAERVLQNAELPILFVPARQ